MSRAGWYIALALVWIFAWLHSASAWIELEQYRYGWAIPPLAVYLAFRRWGGTFAPGNSRLALVLISALGILIFARGVALSWLDPSWRMTGAQLTLGAALVTAGWFLLEGGLPLLKRQIFVLCFAFLALPWPTFIERSITVALLKCVTSAVVAFLNVCGVAAAQEGNVIQLHLHEVGMETACSGIESLQAALMAAIVLGELLFLSCTRRLLLVVLGILLAIAGNFARVSVLAFLTESQGASAAARYHDLAGGAATTILFLSLVVAARLCGKQPPARNPVERSGATAVPAWLGWSFSLAGAAIILFAAGFLHRSAAVPLSTAMLWKVDPARLPSHWMAQRDFTGSQSDKHNKGEERWKIKSPDSGEAYVIYLHWNDRVRTQATAYPHSPALCLPAQGWTRDGALQNIAIQAAPGREITPFTSYRFSNESGHLVALQCLSSGSSYLPPPTGDKPGIMQKVAGQLYRRPRYVSEDMLIYIQPSEDPTATSRMVNTLVSAFRATE